MPPLIAPDYLEASRKPLASLLFLLPLIVAYEVGTIVFARDAATGVETRIIAFSWLSSFLQLFGATGRYLPALAVVVVLLALHIAHGDRWEFRPRILGGMAMESFAWSLPLIALAALVNRYGPLAGLAGGVGYGDLPGEQSLAGLIVLSLGAGIYEELIFRLFAFAVFSFVLTDLLGVKPARAGVITLISTAVLFSLYHYWGSESFQYRTFVFRTAAGAFFGALYLWRGFGVTAGSHAAYDVVIHVLGGR